MTRTPEVWKVEYHVKDAAGEDVDWLSSRTAAVEMAQKIGGSVDKVTEYLTDRETIFEGPKAAEDDE